MRASAALQKKIDSKIGSLVTNMSDKDNDHDPKIKLKRGGGGGQLIVLVSQKVVWPQEHILGGVSKQRITYDQLNLTQFVQGFAKNILEEQNPNFCESMLQYLADLMEDATDFSWANAKASRFSYVRWREVLLLGQILAESTEFAGPMPCSITLHRSQIGPEIPITKSHGTVNLINPTLANFLKIMRLTGKFTITFVLTV